MLVDVTAPISALLPGTEGGLPDDTTVSFERTVSVDDGVLPFFSVAGPSADAVVSLFGSSEAVDEVALAHESDTGSVYRLRWTESLPPLLESLRVADVTVLSVTAADETVTFELRFPDQESGAEFYAEYQDPDNPITISRIDTGGSPSRPANSPVTEEQREALLTALEAGYFEIPRRATLVDLSEELSISDSAVSQRLRRGTANVLKNSILAEEDGEQSLADDLTGDAS
ncbi:MAG: helix-turn-helix domain-containing protein [Halobacteriaceae archaeon]